MSDDASCGAEAAPAIVHVVRAAPKLTCHGCKHCWYSAPGGQLPRKPYPHSRCLALNADIPMVLGPGQKWLGSEVPTACPVHAQPSLFEEPR